MRKEGKEQNFSVTIIISFNLLWSYFFFSPRSLTNCQMLLFSATYDTSVMEFAEKIIPHDPIIIKLRREEESLDNIKQYYIECSTQQEKFEALSNIYSAISIGQSMIFCAVSFSYIIKIGF